VLQCFIKLSVSFIFKLISNLSGLDLSRCYDCDHYYIMTTLFSPCILGVGKSLCGDMLRRYHQTKTQQQHQQLSPSYVYDSCQLLLLLLQFSPLLSIFGCLHIIRMCLSVFEANANLCSDAFCQRLKSRVKVASVKLQVNNSLCPSPVTPSC